MMGWKEVEEASRKLAGKVVDSGFRPDTIVGLARGGWVPARNLCDFLGVKELFSIKAEHWGVTAQKNGHAKLCLPLDMDMEGRRVLVVDDCADTGESLKLAKEHVLSLGPAGVRTATMQTFDTTPDENLPDMYAERVPWKWIVYPWNVTEDMINITASRLEGSGMASESIAQELEGMGLSMGMERISMVLEEAKRRGMVLEKGGKWFRNG